MEGSKNGYTLTKKWFDWCLDNREQNSPALTALYLYIIERCNSLGWKEKFGIPTEHTMYILAIGSYNTYKKHLQKLNDIGFIKIHEKSKNQFSSNIIGLSNFDEPTDEASDEPRDTLVTKQVTNHVTSLLSHNKTIKQETKKLKNNSLYDSYTFFASTDFAECYNDFVKMRKKIKKPMTERAEKMILNKLVKMCGEDTKQAIEILERSILKNWQDVFELPKDNIKPNNTVAKPNTPIDYKMKQHLEHDKNIRNQVKNHKKPFVYGSQMNQFKKR